MIAARVRNRKLLRELRRQRRIERNNWWVCFAVPPPRKQPRTKRLWKKYLRYFKQRAPYGPVDWGSL